MFTNCTSFDSCFRYTSALSGSASLLSGSLSKIFSSFLSYPDGCLRKNDRPKSLSLLKGENDIESAEDKNEKEKDKDKDQSDNKRNKKDSIKKIDVTSPRQLSEKENRNFYRRSSDSGKGPSSGKNQIGR